MRYPQRLATRLSVSFVLLFLLTFIATAAITIYFAQRNFAGSTDDTLLGVAETFRDRIANGEEPRKTIDDLSSASLFIEMADLNGRPTMQSANLGLRPLPTFVTSRQRTNPGFHSSNYGKAKVRLVRYPLTRDGALSGYVVVATPIDTVGDSVQDLAIALATAGGIGLILAVGGTLWLSRREARPLRELAEAARTTASSGFETAIPEAGAGSLEARELRLALADLVQRQQEVLRRERAFFADSSHVLRTPLAVLQGELEVLEQGVYGREREEVMAHARASVETLSRAVSGLLLLAREQEGPLDPSWEVIDLSALLRRLAAGAAVAAPALAIEQEIEEGVEVAGDPHQLHDLFTSVIENGCRYTSDGGTIRVVLRSSTEDGDAVVEVRDSGIGFSPADLSRATERFYRGEAARRIFPGGSGLGLAIAHRIVGLHRGTIHLGANNGKGATVRITLPLVG